jgi:DNA-directed RNA polymerase specialized sigma24 family protein
MSQTIECQAVRRDRTWVVCSIEHGVYGHGRTLKLARDSIVQGLALLGVAGDVELVADSPELDRFRRAQEAYEAALKEAVRALALRRTSLSDIALATGVSAGRVREALAEPLMAPTDAELPVVPPGQEAEG